MAPPSLPAVLSRPDFAALPAVPCRTWERLSTAVVLEPAAVLESAAVLWEQTLCRAELSTLSASDKGKKVSR